MSNTHAFFATLTREDRLLRNHGFDNWPNSTELARYAFSVNDKIDAICDALQIETIQDTRGNWVVISKNGGGSHA